MLLLGNQLAAQEKVNHIFKLNYWAGIGGGGALSYAFPLTILREFFVFGVSCFDHTNFIWINAFPTFQTTLNAAFLIKMKFYLEKTKHDKRNTKIHEPLL